MSTPGPLGRRAFLGSLGHDSIRLVGNLAGALGGLHGGAAMISDGLVRLADSDQGRQPAPAKSSGTRPQMPLHGAAWREMDQTLRLIDQRDLPGRVSEIVCTSGTEVAAALRLKVVDDGPIVGEIGAMAIAITADLARDTSTSERRAQFEGTAGALAAARPTSRVLEWSVERMRRRWRSFDGESGDDVADALRREAQATIADLKTALSAITDVTADLLQGPRRAGNLLIHGAMGARAGGGVVDAIAVRSSSPEARGAIHIWVLEGRPTLAGTRITAWDLSRQELVCTISSESAAGGLMARGTIDLVIVSAERIARNGDVAAPPGSYALAVLAARHKLPFYVSAPSISIDRLTPAGWAVVGDERPSAELTVVDGSPIAPPGSKTANPAIDIVSNELVTGFLTDRGLLEGPFGSSPAWLDSLAAQDI